MLVEQRKLSQQWKMLNEYSIGDSRDLLKEVESNTVDLIYIDPPYCTGRDFYHFDDRFKSSADYRELLMRPLLTECHRVLSNVGNIVVHVEPKVSHHIRIVLDEVFGENRFKNEIVWISGGNHKSKKQLQRNHDTIIVYQKGKESIYNPEHKEYDPETVRKAKFCPYRKKKYNTSALVNRQPNVVSRPNLRYEWNGNHLQWHVSKERMQMLHDDNRLEYSPITGVPRVKKFLDEMDGIPVKDVWSDIKDKNWIVYTGTHDNSTSLGWWVDMDQERKEQIKEKIIDSENFSSWELIRIGMEIHMLEILEVVC